jgi:hypothetical protein
MSVLSANHCGSPSLDGSVRGALHKTLRQATTIGSIQDETHGRSPSEDWVFLSHVLSLRVRVAKVASKGRLEPPPLFNQYRIEDGLCSLSRVFTQEDRWTTLNQK